MNILRKLLLQISVICSFVCIIAKILDWYNPFMDFSGHIAAIQYCLYTAVLIYALTAAPKKIQK